MTRNHGNGLDTPRMLTPRYSIRWPRNRRRWNLGRSQRRKPDSSSMRYSVIKSIKLYIYTAPIKVRLLTGASYKYARSNKTVFNNRLNCSREVSSLFNKAYTETRNLAITARSSSACNSPSNRIRHRSKVCSHMTSGHCNWLHFAYSNQIKFICQTETSMQKDYSLPCVWEWPSSALRMRTTNLALESSVDWSLYINIKKKKCMAGHMKISRRNAITML